MYSEAGGVVTLRDCERRLMMHTPQVQGITSTRAYIAFCDRLTHVVTHTNLTTRVSLYRGTLPFQTPTRCRVNQEDVADKVTTMAAAALAVCSTHFQTGLAPLRDTRVVNES